MSKVISRTVWLLAIVSLFNDVASEILYPVMPVYLRSIGFTVIALGVLEGIAEAIAGLSKGYFGNLSDQVRKRLPFVQIGYGLSALARILLALFSSIPVAFAARLSDRTGKGVRTAARDAMLSAESTPQTKATVFGFHRSMDTIGAVLGPSLALAYLYYNPHHYQTLLLIAAVPGLFAVITTLLLHEKKQEKQLIKNYSFFSYLGYWKNAQHNYKYVVVRLLLFAMVNSADVFLLLLLKEKGFTDVQMIGFYIFYNLIYASAAYPAGKIADEIGISKVLIAGILLFSFVYAAICFSDNLYVTGALFFAYGLYAACFSSTSIAFIAQNCRPGETGTAIGFYSGFASIASLIASTWTGVVWHHYSPQHALLISGIVSFIIGLSLIRMRHDK